MSVKPSDARAQFCNLMCDIFQFAKFDLDFGMYRIMNRRRDKIQKICVSLMSGKLTIRVHTLYAVTD